VGVGVAGDVFLSFGTAAPVEHQLGVDFWQVSRPPDHLAPAR
jgi:hypothetical protein